MEKNAHWATLRAKKNEFDKDFSRFMINKHQNQFQATKCLFFETGDRAYKLASCRFEA